MEGRLSLDWGISAGPEATERNMSTPVRKSSGTPTNVLSIADAEKCRLLERVGISDLVYCIISSMRLQKASAGWHARTANG